MDIGFQLNDLLKQKGLTQKQLAKDLNISATTLNGYMKSRRRPDANTVIRLASYFHTTIDYLYGVTSIQEPLSVPCNAEELHLVNMYRKMSEDKKLLYIETGEMFLDFDENPPVPEDYEPQPFSPRPQNNPDIKQNT